MDPAVGGLSGIIEYFSCDPLGHGGHPHASVAHQDAHGLGAVAVDVKRGRMFVIGVVPGVGAAPVGSCQRVVIGIDAGVHGSDHHTLAFISLCPHAVGLDHGEVPGSRSAAGGVRIGQRNDAVQPDGFHRPELGQFTDQLFIGLDGHAVDEPQLTQPESFFALQNRIQAGLVFPGLLFQCLDEFVAPQFLFELLELALVHFVFQLNDDGDFFIARGLVHGTLQISRDLSGVGRNHRSQRDGQGNEHCEDYFNLWKFHGASFGARC